MDKLPVPIMLLPAAIGKEDVVNDPPCKNTPPVNELDALLKVNAPAPSLIIEAPLPLITPLNVEVVLTGLVTVREPPLVTVLLKEILPPVLVKLVLPVVVTALLYACAPVVVKVLGVLINMPAEPVTPNEATVPKVSFNVTILFANPADIPTAAPELMDAPLSMVMLLFVLPLLIVNDDALIELPEDKTTAEPPPVT